MKAVIPAFRPTLAVAAAMLACACSSSDPSQSGSDGLGKDGDAGTAPDTSGSVPDFLVKPSAVYSGYDGTHTFRIPIAVYGAGSDLNVTLADPSAVSVEPAALVNTSGDDGKWYMLTVKQPGQTSLTATSGGHTGQISINVVSYASDRYGVGQQRYMNGDGDKPPCTQCHGGQNGIDHSPAALASAQDNQVATVIATGQSIAGFPIQTTMNHRWAPDETTLDGLVTYLRALPPRGFVGVQ
ncbi:MAG TPA: hypothetical protein VNO21_21740 [Polyangiaceae bacterium]|nr:hypothetical protein [Polyangiaceae bacterium]